MSDWHKSSYSRDDCVEVRTEAVVEVADTKVGRTTRLAASPAAWAAFLEVTTGEVD